MLVALVISREDPGSRDARDLIARLDAEMAERYPATSLHPFDPGVLRPPHGALIVARLHGVPVGCAGVHVIGERTGEIKRMFVDPEHRRRGIGWPLLEALEREARALDCDTLVLETGTKQPEAVAFYRRAGYKATPPYPPYVDDPESLCFRKRLA